MSEIIFYEDPDVPRAVQVSMEGELEETATCKDFLQVQTNGVRQVERSRKFYNLEAIISIGDRGNSKRGVHFRHWATTVLCQHLRKENTLDRHRLAERGIHEARAAGFRRSWNNLKGVRPLHQNAEKIYERLEITTDR